MGNLNKNYIYRFSNLTKGVDFIPPSQGVSSGLQFPLKAEKKQTFRIQKRQRF